MVHSPVVLCPTKPWTGEEGVLRAIRAPPLCVHHRYRQLAAEAKTDTCLKARLLAVVLGPPMEVRGRCLGSPQRCDSKHPAVLSTGFRGYPGVPLAWEGSSVQAQASSIAIFGA